MSFTFVVVVVVVVGFVLLLCGFHVPPFFLLFWMLGLCLDGQYGQLGVAVLRA